MGRALRADGVRPKRLTHRSMEARRLRRSRAPAKKFGVFRFRANALLSWASFLFPNRVEIPARKLKKWTVFTEPFAHNWEDSLCARCYSLRVWASWPYRDRRRAPT